jgi:ubiquinone/menaquinone biosynthesis C-methylase UbiE
MTLTSSRTTTESWHQWADERMKSGHLEQMISEELFDHTWQTSARQIIDILALKPGETVVDAGSGWGRMIHALKSTIPTLRIRGYELTPEFANRSRELLQSSALAADVEIECADLTEAKLPCGQIDAFYSTRVLHYIEDKQTALGNLYDSLRPCGRGLVIIPNRHCPYRWLTYRHAPLYPIGGIGAIMAEVGFKNLRYGGFGFFPPRPRLAHTSIACRIDQALSRTPLSRLAGLAYVCGTK